MHSLIQFIDACMEMEKMCLQSLVERARAVHNKLNDEIESSVRFCKVCSENGRYCNVTVSSFTESERLIALRNSLKEVEDLLVYLQELQAWQLIDKQAALVCFEKSRLHLMEQVKGYQGEGRSRDVVDELSACFGNEKSSTASALSSNSEENKKAPLVGKKRIFRFLISCMKYCCDPWKWQNNAGVAAKMLLVSATLHIYHSRRQHCCSQRRILSFASSSTNCQLHVVSGRG